MATTNRGNRSYRTKIMKNLESKPELDFIKSASRQRITQEKLSSRLKKRVKDDEAGSAQPTPKRSCKAL